MTPPARVASAPHAGLFLYPGEQYLFTDRSLPSYDETATSLLMERVTESLTRRSLTAGQVLRA